MGSKEKKEKKKITISKETKRFLLIWAVILAVLLVGSLIAPVAAGPKESIREAMRDAVLHNENRISLFGIMDVNPSVISGLYVTCGLLLFALIIRLFVIPKFTYVPGKLQLFLETVVNLFDNMAKTNSPWRNNFLGAYIFGVGVYIFIGTLFELLGFQVVTSTGRVMALPAPLADINSAIMIGAVSYLVIFFGAVTSNGMSGLADALKEISLLISMSFRIFGALLSGLLVTELVYYYTPLSFGIPVVVAVLFTLIHALIQAYVLTTLTSMFYGEKTEPKEAKHS